MKDWPSTTQVLKDAGLYGDSERWFRKADRNQPVEYACPTSAGRGRAIDAGCNLLAMGKELQPEWIAKHEACCVPFIDGYRDFLARHKVNLIDCAFEVIDKNNRFVGHPDQLVMLDGKRTLIDIKTGGMPICCDLQLASYHCGMLAMGMPPAERVGLQLARGDFEPYWFNDPRDFDKWLILVRNWWIVEEKVGHSR